MTIEFWVGFVLGIVFWAEWGESTAVPWLAAQIARRRDRG